MSGGFGTVDSVLDPHMPSCAQFGCAQPGWSIARADRSLNSFRMIFFTGYIVIHQTPDVAITIDINLARHTLAKFIKTWLP